MSRGSTVRLAGDGVQPVFVGTTRGKGNTLAPTRHRRLRTRCRDDDEANGEYPVVPHMATFARGAVST